MKTNKVGIPIDDTIKERKYIVCCRKFDEVSAAACPCVGQIATDNKFLARFLYNRWNKWSYRGNGYTIAVMLLERNKEGTYDAIER